MAHVHFAQRQAHAAPGREPAREVGDVDRVVFKHGQRRADRVRGRHARGGLHALRVVQEEIEHARGDAVEAQVREARERGEEAHECRARDGRVVRDLRAVEREHAQVRRARGHDVVERRVVFADHVHEREVDRVWRDELRGGVYAVRGAEVAQRERAQRGQGDGGRLQGPERPLGPRAVEHELAQRVRGVAQDGAELGDRRHALERDAAQVERDHVGDHGVAPIEVDGVGAEVRKGGDEGAAKERDWAAVV